MDPCPFVRIVIGSLALKFPAEAKPPPTSTFDCKIKLKGFLTQSTTIPAFIQEKDAILDNRIHACFNFSKSELVKLVDKSNSRGKPCSLKIEIYGDNMGFGCFNGGKLLGSVLVPLDLKSFENIGHRGVVIKNGWVSVGGSSSTAELNLNVRAEPDPRFVFQFDGEPECSPQVFQVNGKNKQPVFTCKFSFRNSGDRNLRSRSSLSEPSTSTSCFSSDKETPVKERKGWSITVHDLSGSPVAAASMVTPFVPSQGSDRVSKSNPGSWLILRPGDNTWKPWGRLEAWRESNGELGYRFEIIPDGATDAITLVNSTISTKKGGKIGIDIVNGTTPLTSPNSSFDLSSGSGSGSDFGSQPGSGSWAHLLYRGFVMSSTVGGDGKCSQPEVEVGVQHVSCAEDAAAFVALAAAMDLSMDACRSFSQKLRKELRQQDQELW
ncbi:PREDICTED: uncharacterized protein LOC109233081 [Nicotiana attenuata]|uniref:Formin-like protein 18 n=1 Tax=Nicotiana attenuata TaxID=49451 RepID=A0A1J6IRB7_NICAT|nr:PREDICTED: uncharacterized protein LOC109233081 [Nicotiana attenuata]OIS97696.1 hypothetical protein A4A49_07663 [Nicotiana attenuata]